MIMNRTLRRKLYLLYSIGLTALLLPALLNLNSTEPATSMSPTPFICDGSIYISQGNSTVSSLYTVDSTTTPFGLNLIFGPEGFQYNSMGYNIINGEIHALVRSTGGGFTQGDFISIDGAGNITNYGQPDVDPNDAYSGDVDENGIHYLNKGKNLYAYDTKDPNYPVILSGYPKVMSYSTGSDIAYRPLDGMLYSINNGKLQIVNPTTAVSTQINLTVPSGASYSPINGAGAMWVDATGTVYGYQNDGFIYEINVDTGVSIRVSSAASVSTNDGTGCAYAPVFTKSVSPNTIKPGDELTYQFVILNGLLTTDLEYTFEDTLPGNFTYVGGSLIITGDIITTGVPNNYSGNQTLTINNIGIGAAGVATITVQANTTFDTLPGDYINQAKMTELLPSLGGTKKSDWIDGPEFNEPTPNEVSADRILTIDKILTGNQDQDGSGNITVNDTLTYTFTITNDGDLRMYNVTATDPKTGMSPLTCAPAQPLTLDPGDGYSCWATYSVTQDEIDNGLITNTASVTGADIGGTVATGEDSETTVPAQNPAIELHKRVASVTDTDGSSTFSTGDLVNYTFTITNTGDTTLENVTLTDPLPGILIDGCAPAQGSTLGLGNTMSCTAVYTATLNDVNAGDITNTATVSGNSPNGIEVDDSSTASVFAAEAPDITLLKTVANTVDNDSSGDVSLNDTINYQFVVTNSGNVTLDSIQVTDPLAGLSTPSCPAGNLIPGASKTCTATYTVTQNDVNNGSIDNTATASGNSPANTTVTDSDVATIGVAQNPAFTLTKSFLSNADEDGSLDRTLNDTLTYQFVITNTGDVRLDNVGVNDPLVNAATLSCAPVIGSSLGLGQSMTCTADYVIIQLDMENGTITNTATATAVPPLGDPLTQTDDVVITTAQKPAINLEKSFVGSFDADLSGNVSVSDTLTFGFVITNTGNVTLDNVQLIDSQIDPATLLCSPTLGSSLGVGAAISCTAEHIVTQTERDYGQVVNDATATGVAPNETIVQDFDTEIVDVVQNPTLDLLKQVSDYQDLDSDNQVSRGDILTYTFTVTNSGDTILENVRVTDPMTTTGLSAVLCTPGQGATLNLGDVMNCSATYTVTQTDIDNGTINNEATALGFTLNGFPEDDKSPTSLPLNQIPAIKLKKSEFTSSGDPNALVVNDELTYTFTATNTGNVTLNPFTVTDPLPGLSPLNCTPLNGTPRAPGESMTCTATYTVTTDDINNGQVSNKAFATGRTPTGDMVVDADDFTGPSVLEPSVEVSKAMHAYADTDNSATLTVGDVLTYTFNISNTGNTVLFSLQMDDPMPGLSTPDCTPPLGTDLAVNGTIQCTANLTLTQNHFDGQFVLNTVAVTTTSPLSPTNPITDTATENVPLPQIPFIVLDKQIAQNADEDGSGSVSVGDTLTYTLEATNEGNLTLSNVVITDTLEGLSALNCSAVMPITLAPGDSLLCSANYSVPQYIGDLGVLSNTAWVTGTAPNGGPVDDDDSVNELISLMPDLVLDKRSAPVSGISINDPINYTFVATNTGNTTLFNVVISDTLDGLGPIGCTPAQPAELLPGETLTCTAVYPAVTQAQIDFGSITNFAIVTALDPTGDTLVAQDSEITPLDQAPAIALYKSVAPASGLALGDIITFTLTAENSGNTTLNNVVIEDDMSGLSGLTCNRPPPVTLAFGEMLTCTATYTLTQNDVDAGSVTNDGSVSAVDIKGIPVNDTDIATATTQRSPSIALTKTSDPADGNALALGDTVTYTMVTTNTGNVTLANVTVSDTLPGLGPISCSPNLPRSLAPGGSATCTALYTVAQINLDNASLVNNASVTGTPPSGPAVNASDTVDLTLIQSPAILLGKTASKTSGVDLGEVITYTMVMTNSGNVTLANVTISDPLAGLGPLTCSPAQGASVQPGHTLTCSAPYTVTLENMNMGVITNTATVTANGPDSSVLNDTADQTVTAGQMADLNLTKTAAPTTGLALGDALTYTFTVTNVGNVTIDNVVITDPLPSLSPLACVPVAGSRLDPNETMSCTANYRVGQPDIDAASIFNSATVTGRDPNNNPVTETDSASVPLDQNSAIVLVKETLPADGAALAVGDTITYTFAITNSGNTTLQNVTLTDPLEGLSTPSCTPVLGSGLPPGGRIDCLAQLTVTQPHLNSGTITNTATITATDPLAVIVSDSDPATIVLTQSPSIILDKQMAETSGDPDYLTLGDVLTYTFTVTNSGNVSLNNVIVSDPLDGLSPLSCAPVAGSTLAPSQTMGCTATYTVNTTDILAGLIVNTATAIGIDPTSSPISDSDTVVNPPEQTPAATLTKTVAGSADLDSSGDLSVGDVITYQFVALNSGNTPLESVQIADPLTGLSPLSCAPILGSSLAPAGSLGCSATLTVTQAMMDAGSISNVAVLTSTAPFTVPITITDTDTTMTPLPQTADIVLGKTASGSIDADESGTLSLGDTITYTFVTTNTGNVTLSNVKVSDPLNGLSLLDCTVDQPTTLSPDDSFSCIATLAVTQLHVDAGTITNTATVTAQDTTGSPLSATANETVPIQQAADLTLDKSVQVPSSVTAGDTITYSFVATNTGNITLSNVEISDPLDGLSSISCDQATPARLTPNQTISCSATYAITQADIDAGQRLNRATVSGTDPNLNLVSDSDPATAVLPQTSQIDLVKTALDLGDFTTGDEVIFVFRSINSGNVTLSNITINDPFPGLSPLTCLVSQPVTLAPGETLQCQASYVLTEADAQAELIENTATTVGLDPFNAQLKTNDTAEVPVQAGLIPAAGGLTLQKLINGTRRPNAPGPEISLDDTVGWEFVVTNSGSSRIDGISLVDDQEGEIICPQTSLLPTESMSCFTTSAVVKGQYRNVAMVVGQPDIRGAELVSAVDLAHYFGTDNPTAVDLISFRADRHGQNGIRLTWVTGSEVDNFGFEILRSSTGSLAQAEQIRFVPSGIANTGGATYSIIDTDLPSGDYTYWLIDVETTGIETIHAPVTFRLERSWEVYLPLIIR